MRMDDDIKKIWAWLKTQNWPKERKIRFLTGLRMSLIRKGKLLEVDIIDGLILKIKRERPKRRR